MKNAVILVVDDDPKIRNLLRRSLEGDGFKVREAHDKKTVLAALAAGSVDLVTLDLSLGTDDGLDVAKTIRNTSTVPIIMVTAKDDVIDRVVGLEIGADDYITKPFHLREVLARVKCVLRRSPGIVLPPKVAAVTVCWEFDGMRAIPDEMKLLDRDGKWVEMTSGEFKLLIAFLMRPKRVLSREQLMDVTKGHSYSPMDRTIDNQIARLRKKVERNPASPRLITTIRGMGYSFTCDVRPCEDPSGLNRSDSALANSN